MQKVRIITHSGCDLPFEEAKKANIIMLPDIVIFGENQYRNNIDILPDEFYSRLDKLDKSEHLPTSSHPNVASFMDAYRMAAVNNNTEENITEIICITNTSKMAGTYNTASLAASLIKEEEEDFQPDIFVYDSQQISFGMSYLSLEAAKMAKDGACAKEILEMLDELLPRVGVYFIMKSLEYARRGGRIGAIKAATVDALGVKPLLSFSDGTVSDISLNRTFKTGIRSIFQRFQKYGCTDSDVFIFHANNEKDALTLKQMIQDKYPEVEPKIEWVGPVIGLYTGSGCVGIAFKKREP